MVQKRIYIICPVRNVKEHDKKNIEDYVRMEEAKGNKVFYPARDTIQDDGIVNVLTSDREGMHKSNEVRVYYTEYSIGSIFDCGMAFMSYKPILLINREAVKPTPGKSFENFLLELDEFYRNNK
jgi:hypothetical protein